MRIKTLTIAALTWAALGVSGASAEKPLLGARREAPQAARAATVTAAASDPAEPPMQVEMTSAAYHTRGGVNPQKVAVSSGARGTVLKLPTTGAYTGSAELTFKNSAPPMRFRIELTGLQSYDLSSLTLTSGSVSLAVGQVGTGGTTRYFDAKGKAQEGGEGAAYTVTAKRRDNGQVDVELRRAAGAKLGKSVSVSWQSQLDHIRWKRLGGG